jgi:putative ABC transport system permease protein
MLNTILENILNSLDSIRANKLRSALSMLGIIIWVSSVIIMTAIWNGSSQTIVDKIEEMWTNILTISVWGWRWSVNDKATADDILSKKIVSGLESNIDGLDWVLPIITSKGQVIYSSNNMNATIYWVSKNFFEVKDVDIEYWSNFSIDNINNLDKVVILWQEIVTELFESENPIWESIKMWTNVFEVIWVIEENSTLDSYMFLPINTAGVRVIWQKYYSQIIVAVTDSEITEQKEEEIWVYLNEILEVTNTEKLPYNIKNQSEMLEKFSEITWTLTMLLSWIAWISLLVWGIWVMNIMLVSVTERTKEIGIRKAIWAGKKDILLQFLTEASSLSVIGWILWILFSYFVVYILKSFWIAAIISTSSIVISFCFALAIWLIFWILPAYKAAKLRPIDALRFE